MKKVLIFGACSAIATSVAKKFAQNGDELYLTDLSLERLNAVRNDILVKYKTMIHTRIADALDLADHKELLEDAVKTMNGLDIVLIAHGTLPNQTAIQSDSELTLKEFQINGSSVIALSIVFSNYLENQNHGTLAVISSVAGDRGRKSNYIYGSAKGAVTLFLQGLRHRLSKTNVKIITIKPGMVDTPMTAHMPKGPLFASAINVGDGIYDAINKGKEIVYLPSYWRIIMFIIRLIPESIFKKLNF